MTTRFQATNAAGKHVEVEAKSVRALAPSQLTPERTTLFLDDAAVTVDGRYEALIAQFAAMWPMHSI